MLEKFKYTSPVSLFGDFKSVSTSLSLLENSAPDRYIYAAYHTKVVTNHPLSRLQSSVRGPLLSPTRS